MSAGNSLPALTPDRETQTLTCARCGVTRVTVAYQVGGERIAEPTCLDAGGCESRRELAEGKGRTFETAAEAIEWLTEKEAKDD